MLISTTLQVTFLVLGGLLILLAVFSRPEELDLLVKRFPAVQEWVDGRRIRTAIASGSVGGFAAPPKPQNTASWVDRGVASASLVFFGLHLFSAVVFAAPRPGKSWNLLVPLPYVLLCVSSVVLALLITGSRGAPRIVGFVGTAVSLALFFDAFGFAFIPQFVVGVTYGTVAISRVTRAATRKAAGSPLRFIVTNVLYATVMTGLPLVPLIRDVHRSDELAYSIPRESLLAGLMSVHFTPDVSGRSLHYASFAEFTFGITILLLLSSLWLLLLLVRSLLWEGASRILPNFMELKLFENRKAMFSAGVLLLGCALAPPQLQLLWGATRNRQDHHLASWRTGTGVVVSLDSLNKHQSSDTADVWFSFRLNAPNVVPGMHRLYYGADWDGELSCAANRFRLVRLKYLSADGRVISDVPLRNAPWESYRNNVTLNDAVFSRICLHMRHFPTGFSP